jgi:hypothetical protein
MRAGALLLLGVLSGAVDPPLTPCHPYDEFRPRFHFLPEEGWMNVSDRASDQARPHTPEFNNNPSQTGSEWSFLRPEDRVLPLHVPG